MTQTEGLGRRMEMGDKDGGGAEKSGAKADRRLGLRHRAKEGRKEGRKDPTIDLPVALPRRSGG